VPLQGECQPGTARHLPLSGALLGLGLGLGLA